MGDVQCVGSCHSLYLKHITLYQKSHKGLSLLDALHFAFQGTGKGATALAALLAAKGKSKGKGGKLETPKQNLTAKPAGKGKNEDSKNKGEQSEQIKPGKRLTRAKTKDYMGKGKEPEKDVEKTAEDGSETKAKRKKKDELALALPKAAVGLGDDMAKDDAEEEVANTEPKKKKSKPNKERSKRKKAEPEQHEPEQPQPLSSCDEGGGNENQDGHEGEGVEEGNEEGDTPGSKDAKRKRLKGGKAGLSTVLYYIPSLGCQFFSLQFYNAIHARWQRRWKQLCLLKER